MQECSYLKVNFTFDLIFELLRKGDSEETLQVNGEPDGLKF
jgi:hypothetical protein